MSVRWKIMLLVLVAGAMVLGASILITTVATDSASTASALDLQELSLSHDIDMSARSAVIHAYASLATPQASDQAAFRSDLAEMDERLAEFVG